MVMLALSAAGDILHQPDLVCKLFIVTDINTSLNGAIDHMVWSDTVIEHIFDDEEDNEMFEGFTTEDIAMTTEILQRVLDMP